jgi:hypothetical protein
MRIQIRDTREEIKEKRHL